MSTKSLLSPVVRLHARALYAAAGVGQRLRAAREACGYTIKDVDRLTGINFATVNRYECGRAKPEVVNLFKLCAVYAVSADEILGLRGGV